MAEDEAAVTKRLVKEALDIEISVITERIEMLEDKEGISPFRAARIITLKKILRYILEGEAGIPEARGEMVNYSKKLMEKSNDS